MVRSYWVGAVVVGLAWSGIGLGQTLVPSGTGPDQFVTIQETGKPGQRCKILRTWRQADGSQAYQLQALDTGELMTVVETHTPAGVGQRARTVATRIFHWTGSNTPPPGSPVPPSIQTAGLAATAGPSPAQPGSAGTPHIQPRVAAPYMLPYPVPSPSQRPPRAWPPAFVEEAPRPRAAAPNATSVGAVPNRQAVPPGVQTLPTVRTTPAPRVATTPAPSPQRSATLPGAMPATTPAPLPRPGPMPAVVQTPSPRPGAMPAAVGVSSTTNKPASAPAALPVIVQGNTAPRPPVQTNPVRPVQVSSSNPTTMPTVQAVPSPGPTIINGPRRAPLPGVRTAPAPLAASAARTDLPSVRSTPEQLPVIVNGGTPQPARSVVLTSADPAPVANRAPLAAAPRTAPVLLPVVQTASVPAGTATTGPGMAPPGGGLPPVVTGTPRSPSPGPPQSTPFVLNQPTFQPNPQTSLQPVAQPVPQPTVVASGPCETCQPSPCEAQGRLRRIWPFRPGRNASSCACCESAPATVVVNPTPACPTCQTPEMIKVAPAPECVACQTPVSKPTPDCACCVTPTIIEKRPTLLGRLFNRSVPSGATVMPAPTAVATAVPTFEGAQAAAGVAPGRSEPVAKVTTETAKPGDWQESWGKTEPFKQPAAAGESDSKAQPTARTPDPLQDPDWYRNRAKDATANHTPPAAPPAPATPAGPQPPTGLGSVAAARSPQLTGPDRDGGSAFSSPTNLPADAPNAFTETAEASPTPPEPQYNAFPSAPPGPAVAGAMPAGPMPRAGAWPVPPGPRMPMRPAAFWDGGIPQGMANAFTPSWTQRPIPAEFGQTPYDENAFEGVRNASTEAPDPRLTAPDNAFPPSGSAAMANGGMGSGPAYPPQMPRPTGPQVGGYLPAVPPGGRAAALPAVVPTTTGLLSTLQDSLYPSQREWAAEELARQDGQSQPQVVGGLVRAAREDPAGTVRAACVRALARMKVNSPAVLEAMQALKEDRDALVREEVNGALTALAAPSVGRNDSGIQRVGAQAPDAAPR
jgi:hypothetical protein